MQHGAKIDWWIAAAILGGIVAPLLGRAYWVSGIVLTVLLVCMYPQSYETTSEGLLIRTGMLRRRIPYAAITAISPTSDRRSGFALSLDRLRIQYGAGKIVDIAPANQNAFLKDMSMRAPQLVRRGFDFASTSY